MSQNHRTKNIIYDHISFVIEKAEENKDRTHRMQADGITLLPGTAWGIFNAHRPQGCS